MVRRVLLLGLIACGERPTDATAADQVAPVDPAAVPSTGSALSAAPAAAAPRSPDVPEVVAEIRGKPVTWNEVFAASPAELIEAEVAASETRRQAVESFVMQQLIAAEAAKTGQTEEQLVRTEVAAKATPVTDAEIEAFYHENVAQMPGPLEQMRPQIGQYLEQQRGTEVVRALVGRLRTEAGVKVSMPRYRIEVDAKNAPRKGSPTAPVQIVEFSDFQCPYCSDAAATVRKIEEKYGDKVSVVYRNFPLEMHAQAGRAAEAALCANDQGGFWAYHDALFADRKAWTDEDLRGYAKAVDINVKQFGKCLEAGAHKAEIEVDKLDGARVGMTGTPGFYVNGIVMSGAQPIEAFVEVIDAELARIGG
ncbi:MAG: thioredoxin domain-containing protein [Myxococcota bacterium]